MHYHRHNPSGVGYTCERLWGECASNLSVDWTIQDPAPARVHVNGGDEEARAIMTKYNYLVDRDPATLGYRVTVTHNDYDPSMIFYQGGFATSRKAQDAGSMQAVRHAEMIDGERGLEG